MTTTVCMPKDAAHVWQTQYAPDLECAHLKLLMGADAYSRSLADPTNTVVASFSQLVDRLRTDLNPGRLVPEFRALQSSFSSMVKESEAGVLRALDGQAAVSAVKGKLTVKGKLFEGSLQEKLQSNAAIASAHLLSEKDERGKQGGDLLITDHHGNGCVVELKDKANITEEDLKKFVDDAEFWTGPAKVFAFLKKGGIGSCRKLQVKPLLEMTAHGKLLVWFKDDEEMFVTLIPFILGLAGQLLQMSYTDDSKLVSALKAVDVAMKALSQALQDVRSDIGDLDKRQLQLKKREGVLLSALKSVNIADTDAVYSAKKARILETTTPQVLC